MAIAGLENFLRYVSFFNLNRCMVDVEALARDVIDARENLGVGETAVLCNDMAAHRKYARGERPHMQVMYRVDAIHSPQLFSQTNDIDMRWRSLEQNVDG